MITWFLGFGIFVWLTGFFMLLDDLLRENRKINWLVAAKFRKEVKDPFRRFLNLIKILGAFWSVIGLVLYMLPSWVVEGRGRSFIYYLLFIVPLGLGVYWLRRTKNKN